MRIRLAIPEEHLSDDERKHAIDAALEASTRAMVPLIQRGIVPTAVEAIKGGIRWKPEPPGDEHFDIAPTLLARRWGDCDDLGPYHAASLRATGEDPGARSEVQKSGPDRWHATVTRSDGTRDDPSRWAGMGKGVSGSVVGGMSVIGAVAPIWGPLHPDQMAMAALPVNLRGRQHVCCRVDVPDQELQLHYSALNTAPTVHGAIIGAVNLARSIADSCAAADGDVDRLATMQALLSGVPPEEVYSSMVGAGVPNADRLVDECMTIGSFFDTLADVATSAIPGGHAIRDIATGRPVMASLADAAMDPFGIKRIWSSAPSALHNDPTIRATLQAGLPAAATAFGGPAGNQLMRFWLPPDLQAPGAPSPTAQAMSAIPGMAAPGAGLPDFAGLNPLKMLASYFPPGGAPSLTSMLPFSVEEHPSGAILQRYG